MKIIRFLMIIVVFSLFIGCPKKKDENQVEKKEESSDKVLTKNDEGDIFKQFLQTASILDKLSEYDGIKFEQDKLLADFESIYIKRLLNDSDDMLPMFFREYSKNKELYEKYLNFIDGKIEPSPEKCFLYLIKGFWSAVNYRYEPFFHSLKMLEIFSPDSWSYHLLKGYGYFQRWENEDAIKHLKLALESYCEKVSSQKCLETSEDYTYTLVTGMIKKIEESQKEEIYAMSKFKISNHEDCYFMEINKENNEEGESVFWTGICKNGWTEGKGELIYKKSGNRYKVFMDKGRMNGSAEIVLKDGRKVVGEFKNNIKSGLWKHYNKKGVLIKSAPVNQEGKYHGSGFEIVKMDSNNVKFEGNFKNGEAMRDGKTFCFWGTDKESEFPYIVHRYIKKSGQILIPICNAPPNWKENVEQEKLMWKKRLQKVKNNEEKYKKKKHDCSLIKGFGYIRKN
jgi:hypothetical protein